MVVKESDIAGALARAYCYPENAAKELDSSLLVAMTKEIMTLQRGIEYCVFQTWLKRDYPTFRFSDEVETWLWDAWQTRGNPDMYDELVKEATK